MKKVEHIGIAVTDLASANEVFRKLLGEAHYKIEAVESEGVNTSFFQVGETKVELLESTDHEGSIGRFLEKRGQGMHHIAFWVEDIRSEMERLEAEGFELLNTEPKQGADGKLICFVHPKTTAGVLVELCQDISQE